MSDKQITVLHQVRDALSESLKEFNLEGVSLEKDLINKIWSIGTRKCFTNILLNISGYCHPNFWDAANKIQQDINDIRKDYNSSFINGFQLAGAAGPLCEEPMTGVCFVICEWNIENEIDLNSNVFGPFSGKALI